MDEVSILVVEDDKVLALEIEMMIVNLGYKFIGNPVNEEEVFDVMNQYTPDLIIMDINIEGAKNGVEIAKEISQQEIPIIFITAFKASNYFQEAILVGPAAYLYKPFHMNNLQSAIELAVMKLQRVSLDIGKKWSDTISPQGFVFIKSNRILRKIQVKEICWIEVIRNHCYLYTKEKKYILTMSLSKLLGYIQDHAYFIRVHKNYVVQIIYIKDIDISSNVLELENKRIPIGRKYKKELLNNIQHL